MVHTISPVTTEQLTPWFHSYVPTDGLPFDINGFSNKPNIPTQSIPVNGDCPLVPTQTINTQVTVPNSDMIVPLSLQTKPAGCDSPCHR